MEKLIKVHSISENEASTYNLGNVMLLNTRNILKVEKLTNDTLEKIQFVNEEDKEALRQSLAKNRMQECPSVITLSNGDRLEVAESIACILDLCK